MAKGTKPTKSEAASAASSSKADNDAVDAQKKAAEAVQAAKNAAAKAAVDRAVNSSDIPEEVETVIVTVPKRFVLRLSHTVERTIEAGVQKIEKEIAEHWWCKNNGMQIFDPDAPIPSEDEVSKITENAVTPPENKEGSESE